MNAQRYLAKCLPIGMSGWVLAAALVLFTVSVARAASVPTKVE
jgi:ABC-type multidrug transport system permease subunit